MLFGGQIGLVVTVQFAAPLGLSDVDPVGSLCSRTRKCGFGNTQW